MYIHIYIYVFIYCHIFTEDGETIVRKSAVVDDTDHHRAKEVLVEDKKRSLPQKRKIKSDTAPKECSSTTDLEENIILEVELREPLWNFKLPLKARSPGIVKELWKEVSEAVSGKCHIYFLHSLQCVTFV